MRAETQATRMVADVKCYYCGHVTGQISSVRHQPLRITNFVPRPGYVGPEIKPGVKLRCERCHGPVFLEEVMNPQPMARRSRERSQSRAGHHAA